MGIRILPALQAAVVLLRVAEGDQERPCHPGAGSAGSHGRLESTEPFSFALSRSPDGNRVRMEEKPNQRSGKERKR